MKQLGLDAKSSCISRKIYWKIFQEVSPTQNSVSALRWALYGPPTFQYLTYRKVPINVPLFALSLCSQPKSHGAYDGVFTLCAWDRRVFVFFFGILIGFYVFWSCNQLLRWYRCRHAISQKHAYKTLNLKREAD